MRISLPLVFIASALAFATARCSSAPDTPLPVEAPPAAVTTAADRADESLPPVASPFDTLPPAVRDRIGASFTGDFDQMVERRVIRAGVVFNRTQYFIDKGVQRGLSYEAITNFENDLNDRLKTGLLRVHVAIIPLTRDQLFPALEAGTVDFVAAALTITPERRRVAAFSAPTRTNVAEVVVTAPGVAPISSADDLSGREVVVRRSSSYYESLQALNASLKTRGRPPVIIREAAEVLEDDDLIEMVNAGLMDITVVDDFVAEFWQQIFPNARINASASLRSGGEIAVGVRPNNPKLLEQLNTWIRTHGQRTAFGNIMERRYLQDAAYVRTAAAYEERRKLENLVSLFRKYGQQYSLDYLLMAAQGYQESGLNQAAKSQVGAVGVMQLMPATGGDMAVGDIHQIEPNIHAGVKYFRFMVDQFYKDEPMDEMNKSLMTLASYNAGPGRIRQLRREAAQRGLNPNLWFGNVERVVSEKVGRETVQYVSNIFKYYLAYTMLLEQGTARAEAKQAIQAR